MTNSISLYKEAESFFSNLNIKACPHCEIEVSEDKKKNERSNHTCSLCGEKPTSKKIEEDELIEKMSQIKEQKVNHQKKLFQIESTITKQIKNEKALKKLVSELYTKLVAIPSVETDGKRLKEIEKQIETINKERDSHKELLERKEELIKEEAILQFQLTEIAKEKTIVNNEEIKMLNLKKSILETALKALEIKRIKLNKDTLTKLEGLILNEVHAFGLTSIEEIKISNKYDLIFTQHKVTENFSDLNEGEKLRMKLAFYLSIIQLDIEHDLGRHPRFLIFDSPGSEEMVPKHIHGLSDILKNVNNRYKDQLQIFVGTALREFSEITDKEKTLIKDEEEFVF